MPSAATAETAIGFIMFATELRIDSRSSEVKLCGRVTGRLLRSLLLATVPPTGLSFQEIEHSHDVLSTASAPSATEASCRCQLLHKPTRCTGERLVNNQRCVFCTTSARVSVMQTVLVALRCALSEMKHYDRATCSSDISVGTKMAKKVH